MINYGVYIVTLIKLIIRIYRNNKQKPQREDGKKEINILKNIPTSFYSAIQNMDGVILNMNIIFVKRRCF